jgi:hypothetical protein
MRSIRSRGGRESWGPVLGMGAETETGKERGREGERGRKCDGEENEK